MRVIAGAALIFTLAACSKQEPSPAVAAAPIEAVGAGLPPGKAQPSGHKATLTSESAPATVAATPPAAPTPAAPATPAEPPAPLPVPDGREIFAQTCATCHMADGSGVPYLQPSIKGSAWISAPDPQPLLSLILRGSAVLGEAAKAYDNDMAPQDHLTDAEIAAVATYVRGRFGAPPITEPVTPAQAAIARNRPGLPE